MEYGVAELSENKELIAKYSDKARVLRHRDITGRPIIYIPAKNHSSSDRNIDDLTKFIVYCLVSLDTINGLLSEFQRNNILYLMFYPLLYPNIVRKMFQKGAHHLKYFFYIFAGGCQ